MGAVDNTLCDEKHKHINEWMDKRGDQIDELRDAAPAQISINDRLLEQLQELDKRVKAIEERPQKRIENVVNVISQWAILAVLALIAARLGF